MKLYVAFDNKNRPLDKAFTSYEKAVQYYAWDNYCDAIQEIDLPFIGRNVYYAYLYCGYDYDFFGMGIFDVSQVSDIYPCKNSVRTTELWQKYLAKAKKDPENHIISDELIASYDAYEHRQFFYGDVFEGRFNIKIYKIRVDRSE